MSVQASPKTSPPNSPFVLNQQQRAAVLANAIPMRQIISSQTVQPANQSVINITPRNVGLLKRFIIEGSVQFNNTDGVNTGNLTDLGIANLFSNITFTDLNNNQRINTTGWHLAMLAAMKYQSPLGNAFTLQTEDSKYGSNYAVVNAPATIANNGNAVLKFVLEIPLAYSDDDLRGAVFAGVTGANMNLQLTINPAPSVAAATDSTKAIYKGIASSTLTNLTFNVYQEYLDQLPVGQNGIILPSVDLSTVYELKSTAMSAFTVGNDFPVSYANQRDFLSTFLVYNHDSSADAGRVGGGDINYFALQSANFTNIFKETPFIAALDVRKLIGTDLPVGCYYFSSRRKTISTSQFGNMQLIINPSTAAASAYGLIGWESFALVNVLQQAGSLAAA